MGWPTPHATYIPKRLNEHGKFVVDVDEYDRIFLQNSVDSGIGK